MANGPPHNPADGDSLTLDPRAERIGALLNEYLDLKASGSTIAPEDYITRHPDCADELRSHFSALGIVEKIQSGSSADRTVALDASNPAVTLVSGPGDHGSGTMPTIAGYEVLREIGRGGMGVVYKALQRSTQRVVALKLLLEGPFASEANRKRFEREVALAAQLRHAHIVPIYDSGACDGRMYYAMEYVHGKGLNQYMLERKPAVPERLRIFIKVCHAVAHAHMRGVIHRDLKPSNVLIDGETNPYVHDFGLAKAGSMQDVMLSMTAQLVGTPAYMSPEQVAGDPGGIDMRSDVYSLGVILFELLTGEAPYDVRGSLAQVLHNIQHADPKRPGKVNAEIGDELDTIVLKALAKKREERYQSASELAADVERFLSGDPIQAKRATIWYLARKMLRRHRNEAVIAGLSLLVVTSVLLMVTMSSQKAQQQETLQQVQAEKEKLQRENLALKQQSTESLESFVSDLKQAVPDFEEKTFGNIQQLFEEVSRIPNENLRLALLQRLMASFGAPWVGGGGAPASRPADSGFPQLDDDLTRQFPFLAGRGKSAPPASQRAEPEIPADAADAQ